MFLVSIASAILSAAPASAQTGSLSSLQASNRLNPNISALGWLQGRAGRGQGEAMKVEEVELGFQAAVDPYSTADLFLSLKEGKVEVEEGTLTWLRLPVGFKAGKFHGSFGAFNRVHRPETAFADRPLVYERFFGEESLSSAGLSANWLAPLPWALSVDAEITTPPEENASFARADKNRLLALGRVKNYADLTQDANLTLGGTYAYGPNGREFDPVAVSTKPLDTHLAGADLTLRWRWGTHRALYWTTEAMFSHREVALEQHVSTWGWFSHVELQVARRWKLGGRLDWSESPAGHDHRTGGLAYLTFSPSEFARLSLQGRIRDSQGEREHAGFFKTTFSIGPHGAHPF